ncbi:hypothetical protein PTKIN_Ptkin14bG0130100 [Pterospermum kingtungense]
MERLTRLRTLTEFVASNSGDMEKEGISCSLQGLGRLAHLQGELTIRGLGNVAREAPLSALTGLRRLILQFDSNEEMQPLRKEKEAFVLEALQPPPNLETLKILCFKGLTFFPNWMISLKMLKSVTLRDCAKWESLPPMGKLPSLEYLDIYYMGKVKKVGEEFLEVEKVDLGQTSSSVASNNIAFPNLKTLQFTQFSNWEKWEYRNLCTSRGGQLSSCITMIMPRLRSLLLDNCPKLKALPLHLLQNTVTVQELRIMGCPNLEERFKKGSGEDWPYISHIPTSQFMVKTYKEKGIELSHNHNHNMTLASLTSSQSD